MWCNTQFTANYTLVAGKLLNTILHTFLTHQSQAYTLQAFWNPIRNGVSLYYT